jgi:hypothetical protein
MPGRWQLWVVALVLAVVVTGGFAVWQFQGGSTSKSGARIVSASDLISLSGSLGQPIYWVGSRAGAEYELTSSAGGPTFVRYLQTGETAGGTRPSLTVAGYPMANAFSVTTAVATRPGAVKVKVPTGVAFYQRAHPQSVYVAFVGSDYQIELFDPAPQVAIQLAKSGAVRPVAKLAASATKTASSAAVSASAVTASKLASIAKQSGKQIYWAGVGSATTEYRSTTAGRAYVRYLPKGTSVGAPGKYLTVGTYPLKDAYAVTRSLSHRPTAIALRAVPGGAVAFSSRLHPASVYLAYPGSNYQIEVFSPKAGDARALVARGGVTTVR